VSRTSGDGKFQERRIGDDPPSTVAHNPSLIQRMKTLLFEASPSKWTLAFSENVQLSSPKRSEFSRQNRISEQDLRMVMRQLNAFINAHKIWRKFYSGAMLTAANYVIGFLIAVILIFKGGSKKALYSGIVVVILTAFVGLVLAVVNANRKRKIIQELGNTVIEELNDEWRSKGLSFEYLSDDDLSDASGCSAMNQKFIVYLNNEVTRVEDYGQVADV
jgi:hypothetical protein